MVGALAWRMDVPEFEGDGEAGARSQCADGMRRVRAVDEELILARSCSTRFALDEVIELSSRKTCRVREQQEGSEGRLLVDMPAEREGRTRAL